MKLLDHPRVGLMTAFVVGGLGMAAPRVWAYVLWGAAAVVMLATALPWLLRRLRIEIRRVPRSAWRDDTTDTRSGRGQIGRPSGLGITDHAADLRAQLDANLNAVRDFKARYEMIMGSQETEESATLDAALRLLAPFAGEIDPCGSRARVFHVLTTIALNGHMPLDITEIRAVAENVYRAAEHRDPPQDWFAVVPRSNGQQGGWAIRLEAGAYGQLIRERKTDAEELREWLLQLVRTVRELPTVNVSGDRR
ncbi:MAG TPA: hypothetical protein VN193_11100 [Candidatus Angelobacter sp.]|nr:hypothetical protein [Candidatus Angelobacter sp.]